MKLSHSALKSRIKQAKVGVENNRMMERERGSETKSVLGNCLKNIIIQEIVITADTFKTFSSS